MKKAYFSVLAAFISALALAQESGGAKIDVNVTKDSAWYASPWVWVVGAAVFILLLVALTRGGGRRAD